MRIWIAGLLGVAWLFMATTVQAREITAADRAEIAGRIAAFSTTVVDHDMAASLDFLPPGVVRGILAQMGGDIEDLRAAMREIGRMSFEQARLEDFGMDLEAAVVGTTPDGARDYLLVPTHVVIAVTGRPRVRSDSHSLVFKDGDQWYLLRIQEAAHLIALRQAYPEFAGVEFPGARTSVLD